MRNRYTFRFKLLATFWVCSLLTLLPPTIYYYRMIYKEVSAEAKRNAVRELDHLWIIMREQEPGDIGQLQTWIMELGKSFEFRITYISEDGVVLAESSVSPADVPMMENLSSRAEIMQARSQKSSVLIRYSRATHTDEIYAAMLVPSRGGVPAGILRIMVPFTGEKSLIGRLSGAFLALIATIFTMTFFLSYLLARRLSNPISTIVDATKSIGTRDFRGRIHMSPTQELYPLAQSINQMAERIAHNIQTITEQKQQLEAVFHGMQEGVMVLSSRGRIQTINQALCKLVVSPPMCIGRKPLEVFMSLELQEACDKVLSSPVDVDAPPYDLQVVLGMDRTYDVNIVRLQDQQRGMGAIVVFHDITELKRLEKVRRDFVANVSHELRTPLTSIKGYTETLLADPQIDMDTRSSFLQIILKNTNQMVKMVDDLLQLARLEAKQSAPKLVPVDAGEALSAAWKACTPLAEAKGIRLETDFPEENTEVLADFEQLVQVFRNLLENGIRYSPADEALLVSCRVQRHRCQFGIHDKGPGVPRQHQQRIFERFYRIERHRNTRSGSTGLGLAICRHIVQNHGGRIWVQSPSPEDMKGSTFFFTLKRASEEDYRQEESGWQEESRADASSAPVPSAPPSPLRR